MFVEDSGVAPGDTGDGGGLARAILWEVEARGFKGVILSFDRWQHRGLRRAAEALSPALRDRGLPLFVPEPLFQVLGSGVALVTTALSGGDLARHLRAAAARYGPEHVALAAERVRMDFALPAKSGEGRPLSAGELAELRRRQGGASFFSGALCAHSFTYREGETAHFVLYDDRASLERKFRLGEAAGIPWGFVFGPHWGTKE